MVLAVWLNGFGHGSVGGRRMAGGISVLARLRAVAVSRRARAVGHSHAFVPFYGSSLLRY